jgi:hypothetical protein
MAEPGSRETTPQGRIGSGPLHTPLYRYFFYGWLFRDAGRGSTLERAAALRHNRDRARWLPTYLWRWVVLGALLSVVQIWTERALGHPVLSAALAVAVVLVITFVLVTALCWTILRVVIQR